jgi:hypothetical protein
MATPKLKPAKPVDRVAFEPLLLKLSEARAARFLAFCATDDDQSWEHYTAEAEHVEGHVAWIRSHAFDWLSSCHDEIEREYRKLHGVIAAATTPAEIIRVVEGFDKPKDGA